MKGQLGANSYNHSIKYIISYMIFSISFTDDSASSSSNTPGGRGRGRGRASRGGRGRAYKAHRLGRNASAVSKAIAMNRPRCVGALKHTPDPDRIKGLYSPVSIKLEKI